MALDEKLKSDMVGDLNETFFESTEEVSETMEKQSNPFNEFSDKTLVDKIAELETVINSVAVKQDRNDKQLIQTLRENANFQIQVRQGMQHDIDKLKEQLSGEQFNPILKEIAAIYVEHQDLLEDESIAGLSRKKLVALFEQMEDLLTDNGAEIKKSEIGDIRQTKSTKIIHKIPTVERDKHNTIAASRKPGVLKGHAVLYPEFVDVYIFDPSMISIDSAEEDAVIENKGREIDNEADEIDNNKEGI